MEEQEKQIHGMVEEVTLFSKSFLNLVGGAGRIAIYYNDTLSASLAITAFGGYGSQNGLKPYLPKI